MKTKAPIINLEVNNHVVEVLLDTGSEYSLIKRSAALFIGAKNEHPKYIPQLIGITGKKLRVLGVIHTMIRVGQDQVKSTFAIVPDHYLESPILMGMDTLGRLSLTIDYNRGKVLLNQISYPLRMDTQPLCKVRFVASTSYHEKDKEPVQRAYARLTRGITIKPHTSQFIPLRVDEPEDSLVLYGSEQQHTRQANNFIQTVKDGMLWAPVSNASKVKIKINAGTIMGRYEVIKEEDIELTQHPVEDAKVNTIREDMGPQIDQVKGSMNREKKLMALIEKKDWSHLNQVQKNETHELILKHKELFMVDKNELGLIQQEPAHINVKDHNPCRTQIYRYPEKAKETIANILKDLEERDIIEGSTAAWLSPIVLVNKPSGEKRMCLDYRKVNQHLATDIHPLPNLEELVESVAGNEYYASLDLKDAYYQVMLDEESRDLTTFSEGVRLYRFRRLPFGLSCSSSIFVRQLNKALAPLLNNSWIKSYLDDVVVSAPTYEILLQRLDETFKQMTNVGIKLNLTKCHIGLKAIKFLGHIVSKEGIKPDPSNVEAVTKMKPPTSVKEVRRFLGMVGFYRRHIQDFARIACPLTNLTQKGQPFIWTEECQDAFNTLKQKLISYPILVKADINQPFVLETDASQHHIAAVLMQYDSENNPRVIAYFSRKLRPAEVRYSTTDREAMSVVLASRQFNHYLWGSRFTIRTDHQPLVSVFKQKTKSPRMNRWILEMRDYQFDIQYKSGKNNVVADQLSRPVRAIHEDHDDRWLGKTKNEIIQLQRTEPRWRDMINYLEGGRIPRHRYPRVTLDQFMLEDDILYISKQKNDGSILYLLVLPNELRKEAISHIHIKESGHLGQHKSILKTEEYFYWPNLKVDVKKFVKECVTCQQFKAARGLQQQWQELPSVEQPMDRVSIDVTDMGNATPGSRYVLTVIDHFSRFVNFYPLTSRTSDNIIRKLDDLVNSYGSPRILLTDNAREFCSGALEEWCEENGIRLVHSTPYHPRGNSISERMHRTMKSILTALCAGYPSRWPNYLKKCQGIINGSVHETTGEQPNYLMFKRRMPRIIGTELPQIDKDSDMGIAMEIVKRTNTERARRWRARANVGRKNQTVEVGQLVWVKRDYTTSQSDKKLGVKWIGPYKVLEVVRGGGVYKLENSFDGSMLQRAAEKIKPYFGNDNILLNPQEVYFHRELPEEDEDEGIREGRPPRERRPPARYRAEEGYEFRGRNRSRNSSSDSVESQAIALADRDGRQERERLNREAIPEPESDSGEEEEPVRRRTNRDRRPTRRFIEEI